MKIINTYLFLKPVTMKTLVCLFLLLVPCVSSTVRLSGGSSCSGRVEVYYSGQWGTVCDDSWDINDATVVCREVGCGEATGAPASAHFGQGSGTIWLDEVRCTGTEPSLSSCSSNAWGEENCGHQEDASVICDLPPPVTLQAVVRVSIIMDAGVDSKSPIIQQAILDEIRNQLVKNGNYSLKWRKFLHRETTWTGK
ncbi:scavenger receptor cysteine-rich type 1 protein M130-like [Sardina pilchardus]|uniref:scavenger receptor cysteine-rich type 1 protein M130-like n=1 Tax=Sardina pilchardus TaxID=27697 RepID=UPI002E10DA65